MSSKIDIQVWVCMNADGEYATGVDRDHVIERFEEEIGSAAGCRVVALRVAMTPPAELEADVEIEDDAGDMVEAAA